MAFHCETGGKDGISKLDDVLDVCVFDNFPSFYEETTLSKIGDCMHVNILHFGKEKKLGLPFLGLSVLHKMTKGTPNFFHKLTHQIELSPKLMICLMRDHILSTCKFNEINHYDQMGIISKHTLL